MSEYTVLRAASESLRFLLEDHITNSGEAGLAGVPVDLRSPAQLEADTVNVAVSVWLYRIAVQPDLSNGLRTRVSGSVISNDPLPLELSYLLTVLHTDAKTQLQITGRVAQIVHDHARLRGVDLRDDLTGADVELRLSLDATTLNESSNLWYSLQSPFRLAIPLQLQVATIDSHLPTHEAPPVLVRDARTAQVVAVE